MQVSVVVSDDDFSPKLMIFCFEIPVKVCDKKHIIREKKTEQIRREKEIMTLLSSNREPTAPFFVHLYATFQDSSRLCESLTAIKIYKHLKII